MAHALNGELPECDAEVGAYMAGVILGKHVAALCQLGMGLEQGTAAGMEWVRESAARAAAQAAELEHETGGT